MSKEIIAIFKTVFLYSQIPRGGTKGGSVCTQGKPRGQEAEGERTHFRQGFPREGRREAELAGLWLASLNRFSGILGIEAASSYLVPDCGVIRVGALCPGVWNPHKGCGWGVGSGVVGLHLKNMLTWSWSIPPGSEGPRCQSIKT